MDTKGACEICSSFFSREKSEKMTRGVAIDKNTYVLPSSKSESPLIESDEEENNYSKGRGHRDSDEEDIIRGEDEQENERGYGNGGDYYEGYDSQDDFDNIAQ